MYVTKYSILQYVCYYIKHRIKATWKDKSSPLKVMFNKIVCKLNKSKLTLSLKNTWNIINNLNFLFISEYQHKYVILITLDIKLNS